MTKEIKLTKGYKTIVDDEDFEYLSQFKWHTNGVYALRKIYGPNRTYNIGMHQVVLERKIGRELISGEIPDHKKGDKLNNTRSNLRVSTPQQNMRNKSKSKSLNTTSRFKGVSWNTAKGKWWAQIRIENRSTHIGFFNDEVLAARAYDQTALLWFREFANLNFPGEWLEITNKL